MSLKLVGMRDALLFRLKSRAGRCVELGKERPIAVLDGKIKYSMGRVDRWLSKDK